MLAILMAASATAQDVNEGLKRSNEAEQLLTRLSADFEAGEFELVLLELEQPVHGPLNARLQNLHGLCLAQLERHAEAVKSFELGMRQSLTLPELHRNLARSLLALGSTGRAMAEFEEAVRLDPLDATARLGLATSLRKFRRYRAARLEIDRARELAPARSDIMRESAELGRAAADPVLERMAWMLLEQNYPSADSARRLAELDDSHVQKIHFLERCIERDPHAVDCLAAAGAELLGVGSYAEAALRLEAALKLELDPGALHNLLLAYQGTGELESVERWVAAQPALLAAPSWGVVALLRREAKQAPGALDAIRRARRLDSEDHALANLEAVLLAESGDRGAAVAIWRWILDREPQHLQARANLGG